jgi:hypothetical protein
VVVTAGDNFARRPAPPPSSASFTRSADDMVAVARRALEREIMARRGSARGAEGDGRYCGRSPAIGVATVRLARMDARPRRRQRQLREFAGSQTSWRSSPVSQGVVSRLEIARGLATPLLVVLKINAALARELRRLDPTILSPGLREAVDRQTALVSTGGILGSAELPLAEDRDLEELVRLYRSAPARHRPGLLSVLRAMVAAL